MHLQSLAEQGDQTFNAVPFDSARFTIPNASAWYIEMTSFAAQGDFSNVALYVRRALVKRVGGVITVVIVDPTPTVVETVAAWDANVAVVGDKIVVRLTGAAGTIINWQSFIDGISIGPF